APRFTKVPVDQIGVSGGVASFVCQATGEPKPRVTWNKKGKKVNSQRIETIEFDEGAGAVLRIQPLRTPRDENIYECIGENSEGEVTVSAKLSILRGLLETQPLQEVDEDMVAEVDLSTSVSDEEREEMQVELDKQHRSLGISECEPVSITLQNHLYKKTQETLSTAGQKASAAFSNVGTAISRKFGDMRYIKFKHSTLCCEQMKPQ
ncbi:UNVERIFIED_CONTAM: hypothetical protein FKN15_066793, partial [Acipenser sinensis]